MSDQEKHQEEVEYLREMYLEDLSKIVNYGGNDRPRVRHPGKWQRLPSQILLDRKWGRYKNPLTLLDEHNVWIWSDLHFFHKSIINFSERPYDNVDQMNEHLVANHNDYVQQDDVSIWVGDIGFGNDQQVNELLHRCNGYKILVVGNHDFNKKKIRKLDFDEIHLIYSIPTNEGSLVLTHYPMGNIKEPWFNLHGHLHVYPKLDSGHPLHLNVNCEGQGYKPESMDEIIRKVKIRRVAAEL